MSEASDNSVLFSALLISIVIPVLLTAMGATFGESMTGQNSDELQQGFLDALPSVVTVFIPDALFLLFLPLTLTLTYLPFWMSFSLIGVWLVMVLYLVIKIAKDIVPLT